MYCTNCGTLKSDTASCPKCGYRSGMPMPRAGGIQFDPDNYLVASILLSLCWCLPFGLVGLVYSAKGSGRKEAGDLSGAGEYGRKARMWTWTAFGLGLLLWIIYGIFIAISIAAGSSH